jgi:hypothetical protein
LPRDSLALQHPKSEVPPSGIADDTDKSAMKNFSQKIPCTTLKSLDSDEEIQGNPTSPSGAFSRRNRPEPRKSKSAG